MNFDTISYDQIIYMTDTSLLAYDEENDLYYVVIMRDNNDSEFEAYETFKEAKIKYDNERS